jgi:phosphate transport system protein
MISKSIKGLLEKNKEILTSIIEEDEPKANSMEIDIDEVCTSLIAQFQPTAKDLRTILMILKINNDLERLADHAVNIAESAFYLIEKFPAEFIKDIEKMADNTMSVLKDAITSFSDEDRDLAKQVCRRDRTIDQSRKHILEELTTYMSEDPLAIERSLRILRISSNLERIGDLSTNICEDVIFMVEGTVIKHHEDQKSKEVK